MKVSNDTEPVNTGDPDANIVHHDPESPHGPEKGYVDVAFTIPASLWESIKEESRREVVTTDAVIEIIVADHFSKVEAGLAPMFFREHVVRYVREFCEAANIDADGWADAWIEVHLRDAPNTRPHGLVAGTWVREGIIGDILDNFELEGVTEAEAEKAMLGVLERYKREMAEREGEGGEG